MNSELHIKSIPYRLKDNDILYFLHIPKTSGTSLIATLDSHFDFDKIYPVRTWNSLLNNPIDDFSKYRLIRGHFGYGIYRFFNKKPLYLTMLRNPIDWAFSFYEHLVREYENNTPTIKTYFRKKPMLSDLVHDPDNNKIFINTQIHFIALDLDVFSLTKSINKKDKENFFFGGFPPFKSPDIPIEKLLKIAKQRLSEFIFVGLKEKHEESLMLLCYTFGWRPIYDIPKENVFNRKIARENLQKEIIEKITEWTRYDSELYQHAKKIFELRFSNMVQELKDKYYESKFDNLTFKDMIYALLEKHYENR